jgi:LacI family transcriptional regulator
VLTIVDVARAAGVSTATVSRVINNLPGVGAEAEARVRRAIEELGYRPNRVARTLRTHKNRVWALIVVDGSGPFFAELSRGAQDIAYEAGYSVILCNTDEDPVREKSYIDLAVEEEVRGVVLTPSDRGTDLSPLVAAQIPFVLADRTIPDQYVDSVIVDNRAGAFDAVTHLISAGYRRIACINGPLETMTGERRYKGYCEAIAAAGWELNESLVRTTDFKEAGGRAAMMDLLDHERPDAVFVANHSMAVGVLHAIEELGLAIPKEIAIVSFDDMSWSTLLRPPLSAVAQPGYELGVESARLLLRRLNGYSGPPQMLTLFPSLIVRGSSLPV